MKRAKTPPVKQKRARSNRSRATLTNGRKRSGAANSSNGMWSLRKGGGLQVLEANALRTLPWLVHGFSTKPGGASELNGEKVLNLSFSDWDQHENIIENRKRFQRALGAGDFEPITVEQFHSDVVYAFDLKPAERYRGDALITKKPGLLLAIQTADCVPTLLVDPKQRAIAAVHAGWRGTLARIVQKTIGQMHMHYGTKPGDLVAALGPAIGGCCYEVGTEVVTQFTSQFANVQDWFDELRTGDEPNPLQWLNMAPPGHQPPPKKVRLDLRKANRAQLLDAGVSNKSIFVSDLCTACHPDLFFSYRKQGPTSGRLLSAIGLRP